jgi:hypothetical protein
VHAIKEYDKVSLMNKIKLDIFLPGILIAATGVGAGDLITASMAGHKIGLVLWVPLIGALLKYYLTEGIARYQMSGDETLISGWILKLGNWIKWPFFTYLIIWSFVVGGALISATAASLNALFPFTYGKYIYGALSSLGAMALIIIGNFATFEKVMAGLISLMFITVVGVAPLFLDSPSHLIAGLTSFSLFDWQNPWIIGVLGGVGGTLTIVCYGYWLQESDRQGIQGLQQSRSDLLISYILTALFSMAMMIIGTKLTAEVKGGENFVLSISALFSSKLGAWGSLFFKVGFFCGVFSSLLGVWQSVPYLFADIYALHKNKKYDDLKKSSPYRGFLYFIGLTPLCSLWIKFESIQLIYAVVGSCFIPLCALSLLILGNFHIEDTRFRNSIISNILLSICLLFFIFSGIKNLI